MLRLCVDNTPLDTGYYDEATEPIPLTCQCGEIWGWRWWPSRPEIPLAPRWLPPVVSPCEICGPAQERARERAEHEARVRRAGLPAQLQGWSLRRREVALRGETHAALMRRVRGNSCPTIGVTIGNTAAIGALECWQGKGWLYIEGEVGRGKSVLVGAWVSDALIEQPTHWEGLEPQTRPGQATRVGRAAPEPVYVQEAELLAREKLSWKGDATPLYRTSQAPMLVLDDLGQCARVNDRGDFRVPDWAAEAIERLVCYRYEHLLPTIYVSNLPLDTAVDVWGHRVASRMRERCGRPLVVGGESWRDE